MVNERLLFCEMTFANSVLGAYVAGKPLRNGRIPQALNGRKNIFHISGFLTAHRYEILDNIGIQQTGYDEIKAFIDALPDNGTAMLIFDSGGGYLYGLEQVLGSMRNAYKRGIRLVAVINSLCASAAYMIAANASIIWANRLSTVGSIGVYSVFMDISEALKANGLIYHLLSSGDLKGAEMPEIPKASAFLEWEQRNINDIFDWIKASIPRQVPEEMLRGGVVLGERALQLNLVDNLYTDISEVLNQEQPSQEAEVDETTQEENLDTVEQQEETLEEMTEEEVSLHNVEATKGIKALCADGQDIPQDIGKALLLRFRNMKPQEFNNYIKSMVK